MLIIYKTSLSSITSIHTFLHIYVNLSLLIHYLPRYYTKICKSNHIPPAVKNYNQSMKPNNLFLAELYVGKCKITTPIPSKLYLTFRIGKNMAQSTLTRLGKDGMIDIDARLQLNTDRLALDTQRSSLTLSSVGVNNQITVLGMVLISLPRESGQMEKKYRLAQCLDKNAEIEISVSIKSLDLPSVDVKKFSMSMSSEVSSKGSIMEMQQFDKKSISPPRLFPNSSEKQLRSPLPPKPRSTKQLPSPSDELRESVSRLENQCQGLKELLRSQFKKRQESDKLIDCLVSTLEEISHGQTGSHDLDETLLLEGIDKDDSYDRVLQKNVSLQKEIVRLNGVIDGLKLENKSLSGSVQKTSESTKQNSREVININSAKELGKQQVNYLGDGHKKIDKISFEVNQLEAEIFEKYQEMERYKKKLKITTKLPSLEATAPQRQGNSILSLRSLIQHFINETKQMLKILLKYLKHQADSQSEGFINKIRQKIDKTFGNLIAKKMNRDIIIFQKNELLKAIEQQWQKSG